jgi:hypothetical protein
VGVVTAPRFIEAEPMLIGRAEAIGFGTDAMHVRLIPKAVADALITQNHYSGSAVWSSCVHLGVYAAGDLIGAMQFGPAMNPASGGKVVRGTQPDQWLELNRMWLSGAKPVNAASRAIRYALTLVRRRRPRVSWVQSFADERCGKLGAVYQAAGFLYCGSHFSEFLHADGEWFHKSLVGRAKVDKRGWGSGPKAARLAEKIDTATRHEFRQYRYIRPLTKWARRQLLLPVLPYPKPSSREVAA